jgi:hypothetical protein
MIAIVSYVETKLVGDAQLAAGAQIVSMASRRDDML